MNNMQYKIQVILCLLTLRFPGGGYQPPCISSTSIFPRTFLHRRSAILGASCLSRKRTTVAVSFHSSFHESDGLVSRITHPLHRHVRCARGIVHSGLFAGDYAGSVCRVHRHHLVSRRVYSRECELEVWLAEAHHFDAAISPLASHQRPRRLQQKLRRILFVY